MVGEPEYPERTTDSGQLGNLQSWSHNHAKNNNKKIVIKNKQQQKQQQQQIQSNISMYKRRYQRGNQKPYIEGQTIQWPKDNGRKDKCNRQNITPHVQTYSQ